MLNWIVWNRTEYLRKNEFGALGTVTKGLALGQEELEIRVRVETIQTKALLKSARILRRIQETWGDLLSLKL